MALIWKLLRQHISAPQLAGFFLANLFGMWVVMLGIQFYKDVSPLFKADDGFLGNDFLVVSKHVTTVGTLSGRSHTFSESEIADLRSQPFSMQVGAFTSSQYKVSAAMGMEGASALRTEMFFEAVPDAFVDAPKESWAYRPGEREIPVILPRTYLALYNFGFAQSRGLPKVSDGLASMIEMNVFVHAGNRQEQFRGRILGFSGRLNTILVPQSFIDWSNAEFEPGKTDAPSRLILKVGNPADDRIACYMQEHSYDVEDNRLDAGRATYFLKIVISLVMLVGLLVSVLSFYILMLSIYLLVQKNTTKLQNLLLIGYSPARVSLPYQLLAVGMNAAVFLLAFLLLLPLRSYYVDTLQVLFPQMEEGGLWPAFVVGGALFLLVSLLNMLAVRRKVDAIWKGRS